MSHPHPEPGPPPPLPADGLRILALGGLGEIGRNMTVFEHAGRLLNVDCGVLFPDPDQPGVDLILPDFSALAGLLRPDRGHCPDACARGPYRRGSLPAAPAPGHSPGRVPADARLYPEQARRAPDHA